MLRDLSFLSYISDRLKPHCCCQMFGSLSSLERFDSCFCREGAPFSYKRTLKHPFSKHLLKQSSVAILLNHQAAMASSASSAAILLFAMTTTMSLLAMPAIAKNRLDAGDTLGTGESLAQGRYFFTIQNDCNLVLYDNGNAIWASGTNGRASRCVLKMQHDGNLVIYSGSKAIWASNTNRRNDNYYLLLQRDRNVVIYDSSNNAIWATNTNIGDVAITVIPHSNGTAAASGAAQNKVNELYISMY